MAVSSPRPHSDVLVGRRNLLVWALIALFGMLFAGLTVYRVLSRDLNERNEEKLQELSAATVKPEPRPAGAGLAGADWPQWRGPSRDGVSPETGLLTSWPPAGPKVVWTQPTGDGYSSVVVAKGQAFTLVQDGEHEAVVAWDAASGQERWRFKYPAHFRHRQYGDGPRSTPSVAGEHIYTVGGTGVMHCLKAFTTNPAGEAVWRKDLQEEFGAKVLEWGIAFSPLVENGLVYAMPGGPEGNSLIALDQATGAVVWKSLDDPPSYSSPVAAELAGRRQVVFLTGTRLVGLAAVTGELLWEYPWHPGPAHTPSHISTPLLIHRDVGDYVFNSSGYDKGCVLLKIETAGKGCRATQVFKNRNMRTVFSSCVPQGDSIYGFDDTNLACLDLHSGKSQWKERGFDKGSLIALDGHLIVLGERGTLALVAADPNRYREIARFEHSDQPSTWTVPALANGRLYVRDKTRLVCYDLKTP